MVVQSSRMQRTRTIAAAMKVPTMHEFVTFALLILRVYLCFASLFTFFIFLFFIDFYHTVSLFIFFLFFFPRTILPFLTILV